MLKRHGNYPYDSDSAYPDHPTPAMPPNPIQYSPPAPVEPAPPRTESDPPLAASQPALAPDPPPAPAVRYTMGVPRPIRRTGPLTPPAANANPPASAEEESESPRHGRKCSICNHPYRDVIEDDFVNWIRPCTIAQEFDLTERSICRHARAMGLYDLRGRKLRFAIDFIIEEASVVAVTGETVLRAIRARTRVNESGEWVEPPTRVVFSTELRSAPAPVPLPTLEPPTLELDAPASPEGNPNRQLETIRK